MTFEPDIPAEPPPRLGRWARLKARFGMVGGVRAAAERGSGIWRWTRRVLLLLAAIVLLYYPVGMAIIHEIDDNPDFAPATVDAGESHTVAMMAALIEREVDSHRWVPNDPIFIPSWALDNMPNFQLGLMAGLSRMAVELTDQIGRMRGSSQVDPDLEKAVGYLKYPGDVWIWNPSVSWAPTATSEQQYRAGRRHLLAYNKRLAAGQAVFERRADNLQVTLERIAADLGSSSAIIDRYVVERGGALFDSKVDDIFYQNKGRLYAYYLLLRALGRDYEAVIRERDLVAVWKQMLDSFANAARLSPWVVMNGTPESLLIPNHLASQGFYLLRARTQLREVSNVLIK